VVEQPGRRIAGRDELTPLAHQLAQAAKDETDLFKAGFVFFGSVMLVKLKTMR
jgi:hypothetical protein